MKKRILLAAQDKLNLEKSSLQIPNILSDRWTTSSDTLTRALALLAIPHILFASRTAKGHPLLFVCRNTSAPSLGESDKHAERQAHSDQPQLHKQKLWPTQAQKNA
jgi:hypothetical protein